MTMVRLIVILASVALLIACVQAQETTTMPNLAEEEINSEMPSEMKAEIVPEIKMESILENKTEIAGDIKVEINRENRTENARDIKMETSPVNRIENATDIKVETNPENGTEIRPEINEEIKLENKTQNQREIKSEINKASDVDQNNIEVSSIIRLNSDSVTDLSDTNIPPELEYWDTPPQLVKNFVYYLSGFDYDDRPIWIVEMGKYDINKVVEGGQRSMQQFDNFTRQAALRIYRSHKMRDPNNTFVSYLIDFDGLKLNQLARVQTVAYIAKLAQEFGKALTKHTNIVVIVNANYVTELLINMVKPIWGAFSSIFEVYGTNRQKWLPHVLRHFPKDQIPQWYGGNKDYTPLKVYG